MGPSCPMSPSSTMLGLSRLYLGSESNQAIKAVRVLDRVSNPTRWFHRSKGTHARRILALPSDLTCRRRDLCWSCVSVKRVMLAMIDWWHVCMCGKCTKQSRERTGLAWLASSLINGWSSYRLSPLHLGVVQGSLQGRRSASMFLPLPQLQVVRDSEFRAQAQPTREANYGKRTPTVSSV